MSDDNDPNKSEAGASLDAVLAHALWTMMDMAQGKRFLRRQRTVRFGRAEFETWSAWAADWLLPTDEFTVEVDEITTASSADDDDS